MSFVIFILRIFIFYILINPKIKEILFSDLSVFGRVWILNF